MAWPVVTVASGGIPVTDNSAKGFGTPAVEVFSGFGTAITFLASGGIPVLYSLPDPPSGFDYLQGVDGAYLRSADGDYLLGAA